MLNKLKISLLSLAALGAIAASAWPLAVSAHQPRLVMDAVSGAENPIVIHQPAVSQAFYGELKGRSDYYRVHLGQRADLYLGILAPQQGGETDFNIFLSDGDFGRLIFGPDYDWQPYFEEYGGDWYLKGPEATFNLPPGDYTVMISSADNVGKYALVVGQQEVWTNNEAWKSLWLLPELKTRFFGQPLLALFYGQIYQYVGAAAVAIVALLILLFSLWRYHVFARTNTALMKKIKALPAPQMPKIPKLRVTADKKPLTAKSVKSALAASFNKLTGPLARAKKKK